METTYSFISDDATIVCNINLNELHHASFEKYVFEIFTYKFDEYYPDATKCCYEMDPTIYASLNKNPYSFRMKILNSNIKPFEYFTNDSDRYNSYDPKLERFRFLKDLWNCPKESFLLFTITHFNIYK